MPLDGLRAWIGEVERKLGMRTRVFLVLATIAIGGAGAAIYLAIDTRDDAVSESDVRELQEQLETRIDESAVQEQPSSESPSESARPGGAAGGAKATPKGSKAKLQELFEQTEEANKRAEEEQQGK
ncbi:MAG TPA: hypothetical protein VNP96_03665 [Solirubrobacterales bacterium]|nr:hypothetical protein [Solirubrobacterales bacterium]